MKKIASHILASILSATVLLSCTAFASNSIPAAPELSATAAEISNESLIQASNDVITSYETYYDILDIQPAITQTQTNLAGVVSVDYVLTLTCVLKCSSALQLPYVQGLCSAFGISTTALSVQSLKQRLTTGIYKNNIAASLEDSSAYSAELNKQVPMMSANAFSSRINVAQAVPTLISAELADFISELEVSSIGETIELSVRLRANFDSDGLYISTQYGGYDYYSDDISRCIPESTAEMYEKGFTHAEEIISAAISTAIKQQSPSVRAMSTVYTYNGAAAAAYATSWTSNASSIYCSVHGVYRKQNVNKYNTAVYSTYYCCNDCANFVSQAMHAGGVPLSTTWQPYTAAWAGTISMQNYFVGKGWWHPHSLGASSVGDILVLNNPYGPYHVGIITIKNTVTYAYSGHTNDLLNQVFTGSTFNGEASSVDYISFNPMEIPGEVLN